MRGRSARCPKCGQRMKVPRPSGLPSAPPSIHPVSETPPPRPAPLPTDEGSLIPLSREVDDLLSELDSLPVEAVGVPEGAPLPPAVKKPGKSIAKGKRSSLSLDWSDFALAVFLVVGVMAWIQFELPLALSIVTLGTFLVVIVTMFSHRDFLFGFVCLITFCCAFGPIIAGVRGLQKGAEWQIQRTCLVLLVSSVMLIIFRVQDVTERWGNVQGNTGHVAREEGDIGTVQPGEKIRVALTNVQCFQETGVPFAFLQCDYAIQHDPKNIGYSYFLVVDAGGEHQGQFVTSFSEVGVLRRPLALNSSREIRVWMQYSRPSAFDWGAEELRVSNVVTCTVQQGKAPWISDVPTANAAPGTNPANNAEGESPAREEEHRSPIDAALADLATDDLHRQLSALDELQSMPSDAARRNDVATALVKQLESSESVLHHRAIQALEVWHTPEATMAVLKYISDSDGLGQDAAIELLIRLDERRVVPLLAEMLVNDAFTARRHLEEMGSIVETDVMDYLQYPDKRVQMDACRVLGKVGTKASISELTKLQSDPDGGVRRSAERAIEDIRSRH